MANVQLEELQAGGKDTTEIPSSEPACFCSGGGITGCNKNVWVILRDLEAKLKDTEKKLEDLRGEVKGKNITELQYRLSFCFHFIHLYTVFTVFNLVQA